VEDSFYNNVADGTADDYASTYCTIFGNSTIADGKEDGRSHHPGESSPALSVAAIDLANLVDACEDSTNLTIACEAVRCDRRNIFLNMILCVVLLSSPHSRHTYEVGKLRSNVQYSTIRIKEEAPRRDSHNNLLSPLLDA
jgi:hypothetical protein